MKSCHEDLASTLLEIEPALRAVVLQAAVSFRPHGDPAAEYFVGKVRAEFAAYWESQNDGPVPLADLRRVLEPPVPIATILEFLRFKTAQSLNDCRSFLQKLVGHLLHRIGGHRESLQLSLFDNSVEQPDRPKREPTINKVASVGELVRSRCRFPTIYADPPWQYSNRASRGAAESHYPTMSVREICEEPISEVAETNAHLHLWTTNAFLREAFDVLEAWGCRFLALSTGTPVLTPMC